MISYCGIMSAFGRKTPIGYLRGIRRSCIPRFDDHALNLGMDFELNLIYDR